MAAHMAAAAATHCEEEMGNLSIAGNAADVHGDRWLFVCTGGALLREGVEQDSKKVAQIVRGTRVRFLEAGVDASGKERVAVRLGRGQRGWGSASCFASIEPCSVDDWPELAETPPWKPGDSLAPYISTPLAFLDEALTFAGVGADDVLVDLGCGDGRIPCWAASGPFSARRSGGVELDPGLCRCALEHVRSRGLGAQVEILCGDVTRVLDPRTFEDRRAAALADEATILTVFLLPGAQDVVEPILRRHLRRGRRALVLGWAPATYAPARAATLGATTGRGLDAYLLDATSLPGDAASAAAAPGPSLRLLHSPEECLEFGGAVQRRAAAQSQ